MLEVRNAVISLGDAEARGFALRDISLSVAPGQIVSLAGSNGSGKSTLAALMCAVLLGREGMVVVDGIDPASDERSRLEVRRLVGLVRQNPLDQIVSTLVFDEVAFGPRNLGLSDLEARQRVAEALEQCGLAGFEGRDTTALSGGEQQRLALAGVLAMHPRYLVLDEATSMLDSALRSSFRNLVFQLARTQGIGVVQITHEPQEVLSSDRVVLLHNGELYWEGAPQELLRLDANLPGDPLCDSGFMRALRAAMRLGFEPGTVVAPNDIKVWLISALKSHAICETDVLSVIEACHARARSQEQGRSFVQPGIVAERIVHSYEPGNPVLNNVDIDAPAGTVTLLAGASGGGKSTLSTILAGLVEPDSGTVSICGERLSPGLCGMSFQRPENQLFLNSAYDEIALAPRCARLSAADVDEAVRRAAQLVGLTDEQLEFYPYMLSGGQRRRVAIASVLSIGAKAYIFDEPTAGFDVQGRRDMHRLVRELADGGPPVVVVSHDLEEWLPVVDRVALLSRGNMLWQGSAAEVGQRFELFEHAGIKAPENAVLAQMLSDALQDEACGPALGAFGEGGEGNAR